MQEISASQTGSVIYYHVQAPAGLLCGTTAAATGGAHYACHTAAGPSELKKVLRMRNAVRKGAGFGRLITLKQTHSSLIHVIDKANAGLYGGDPFIEGDGLFTLEKDILLGVLTADCVPVLYFNSAGDFAAIVHAGRTGILKKIHEKMIVCIREKTGIAAGMIQIIIGPHIRNCCYEVGQEVAKDFPPEYVAHKEGRTFLDMESAIAGDLAAAGILPENISVYRACTCCGENPRFYSYRRGDADPRNLSFIGWRP